MSGRVDQASRTIHAQRDFVSAPSSLAGRRGLRLALLLLAGAPAALAAQEDGAQWAFGGALGVSAGPIQSGMPNCGRVITVTTTAELRARRGPLALAAIGEVVANTLSGCTLAIHYVMRGDSQFVDVSGASVHSPRLGMRAGTHLPLGPLSILPAVGGGVWRVTPSATRDEALEPWWSGSVEVGFWRVALRLEHGRYPGLEAFRFERTIDGTRAPADTPLQTRRRWETFTLLGLLLRL